MAIETLVRFFSFLKSSLVDIQFNSVESDRRPVTFHSFMLVNFCEPSFKTIWNCGWKVRKEEMKEKKMEKGKKFRLINGRVRKSFRKKQHLWRRIWLESGLWGGPGQWSWIWLFAGQTMINEMLNLASIRRIFKRVISIQCPMLLRIAGLFRLFLCRP